MPAPKGNDYWRLRGTCGRPRKYDDPNELWDKCVSYFEWVNENPLLEPIVFQGQLSDDAKPLMRAMTIGGLCLFLDVNRSTWLTFAERGEDFSNVVNRVDEIIYTQKFEGASAGLLNPNIIARDLGLAERKVVEKSKSVKVREDMTPSEAAKAYQDAMDG